MVFGVAVGLVMDTFKWRHLVVIYDKLNKLQEAGRSLAECDGVVFELRRRAAEIQSLIIDVDSTSENFTFETSLRKAQTYSRSEYSAACAIIFVERLTV